MLLALETLSAATVVMPRMIRANPMEPSEKEKSAAPIITVKVIATVAKRFFMVFLP